MQKKKDDCAHSCFMCQNILPEWWEVIDIKRNVIRVRKGQRFIEEGSETKGVFFVQNGLVKVHRHWGDKEMIIRFAKNGEIVGHRGLAAGQSLSPVTATAMQDSVLCFVELDFFKTLLRTNNSFAYELMMFYARELQWSEQKMGSLVHLPVKERLIQNLLYLAEHFGVDENGFLQIELTKTDVAAYTGTTYETIHRIISELSAEGLVLFSGKKIKINDRERLKKTI